MPLIRFEVGDLAIAGSTECGCESKLPHLERVTGRCNQHFILSDGTTVGACYFTHLIFDRGWVKSYQIVQEDYQRVLYKVVLLAMPKEADLKDVERKVKLIMGPDCIVEWEFVDRIDTTTSGKHLYIKTKVAPQIKQQS